MIDGVRFKKAMEVLDVFNNICIAPEDAEELFEEVCKLLTLRWATLSFPLPQPK